MWQNAKWECRLISFCSRVKYHILQQQNLDKFITLDNCSCIISGIKNFFYQNASLHFIYRKTPFLILGTKSRTKKVIGIQYPVLKTGFSGIFRNTKSAKNLPNYIKNWNLRVHSIQNFIFLHLYNNNGGLKILII